MIRRFSTRISPAPWQVAHRSEGTRPLPRHTGHGRLTAKPPCPKEIVPRPLHSGQTEMVAPGAAPSPPHVGHTAAIGSVTGTLPPSAATRNGMAVRLLLLGQPSDGSLELVDRRRLRYP